MASLNVDLQWLPAKCEVWLDAAQKLHAKSNPSLPPA